MNARSRPVPFKICIPSRGSARIGVAAVSYQHLQQVVRYKYKVAGEFCFQQEDGTLVCDEEYFRLLEPKTILTVIELPRPAPGLASLGRKRRSAIAPVLVSPPKRLSRESFVPRGCGTVYQQPRAQVYPHHVQLQPTHMQHMVYPQHLYATAAVVPPHPPHYNPLLCGTYAVANTQPLVPVLQRVAGNTPNSSTSLISQLQITNVLGNVTMSPPRQKVMGSTVASRAPIVAAGVPTLAPSAHIVAPRAGFPPPLTQVSPPLVSGPAGPTKQQGVPVAHVPCLTTLRPLVSGPAGPTKQQGVPVAHVPCLTTLRPLVSGPAGPTKQQGVPVAHVPCPTTLPQLLQFGQNSPISATSERVSPQYSSSNVRRECERDMELLREAIERCRPKPPNTKPTVYHTNTIVDCTNTIVDHPNAVVDRTTPPPAEPSKGCQTSPHRTSVPRPTEPEEPRKDSIEHTPVAKLQVVSSDSEKTGNSTSDSDDADHEKEEEARLCIIEQPSPAPTPVPTPTPTPHKPLYHVPFSHSPRPRSLGDPEYPIIIDGGPPSSVDGENDAGNACSTDEGYSSSTSPFDSRPHDFSSLLPFADYEEPSTAAVGGEDSLGNREEKPPAQDSSDISKNAGALEMEMDAETTEGIDSSMEWSADVEEEEEEEEFEEDFVLDIDVFSPAQPPTSPSQPSSTGAPDVIPSISSDAESGENSQLIIRIDRGSLSQVPSSPPPMSSQRQRSLTVSLPLSPSLKLTRKKKHEKCRSHSDPLYIPETKSHYFAGKTEKSHSPGVDREAPELLVRIPVRFGPDGSIRCEEEDGDDSITAMELLASRLEGRGRREGKRMPEIVRLESHYTDVKDEENVERLTPEPTADVAEYVILPSLCSKEEISKCVRDLGEVCNEVGGVEGGVAISLEVELDEESPELTGMELLNLRADQQHHSQSVSNTSSKCSIQTSAAVYCEDFVAEIERLSAGQRRWKVHSLTDKAGLGGLKDPRLRVQQYRLGNKELFELSCISGRWHLKSLCDGTIDPLSDYAKSSLLL